jgi:nucleoid-associated protein YgaU
LVALGTIVLGLIAALPFRQAPVGHSQPQAAAAPLALPLRRPDAPLELALPAETSPAAGLASPADGRSDTSLPPFAATGPAERLGVAPPPAMPIAFHPITDEPKPTSWKPTPPPQPVAKPRKYLLRDGDSLERLAERFLGDKARAAEIFEMNRHVLSRADLLPVGAEIVLPARMAREGS